MRSARVLQTFIMIVAFVGCFGGVDRQSTERQQVPATPEQEFAMLDEYGDWQTIPGHGDFWRPNVPSDWAPYRYGQWEWTDRGWMWVSDEQFGWVVYHYGLWEYDDNLGWLWAPGYEWSPARVSWYVSDNVIGWAPMAPQGAVLPPPDADVPGRWWSFVDARDFASSDANAHRYREAPRLTGSPGTKPPDVRMIGRTRGQDIPQYRTESERLTEHGRTLFRVNTRPYEPIGASAPPPPPPPSSQAPMDIPPAMQRGGNSSSNTSNNQPERGESKRQTTPAAPVPPPAPPPPSGGKNGPDHATVKTADESKVDTAKTKTGDQSRDVHKR
ncbi:MAG TPA: DUF6600 domain-containing protein [Bacteroidota bacterium]|nr:DUF6600 domain-containing protein [Bacteroidota bacterium]